MTVDQSDWIVQSLDELMGKEIEIHMAHRIHGENYRGKGKRTPIVREYRGLITYEIDGIIVPDVLLIPTNTQGSTQHRHFVESSKNQAIFKIMWGDALLYYNKVAREKYAEGQRPFMDNNYILKAGIWRAPME